MRTTASTSCFLQGRHTSLGQAQTTRHAKSRQMDKPLCHLAKIPDRIKSEEEAKSCFLKEWLAK